MKKSVLGFAALAISLLVTNGAQAAIIFGTGNPGNAGTDNVIFNACTSNTLVGSVVNGCLQSDHTELVNFFNANESLTVDGGQALIEDTAGDGFTQLEFGFADATAFFTKAIFNINNVQGDTGTVTITANLSGGGTATSGPFAIANGSNFFYVETTAGELIDTIFFVSSVGVESVIFQDTRQVRLGGTGIVGTDDGIVTPEPAMLSILGVGLLAAAARLRRRRS